MAKNETMSKIINDTAVVLGLPESNDVAGSTDPFFVQMRGLLNLWGRRLIDKCDWEFLTRTITINTTPPQLEYPIPVDIQQITDSTGWNNTARIPLIGPLTPQQWRLLIARQLGGTTLRMQYIIERGKITFYFVPDTPQEIQFDAQSRSWVQDGTDNTIFKDEVENNNDIILYDSALMVTMLAFRWRQTKGFNTVELAEEFNTALNDAIYNNRPKNTLLLSNQAGYPYLGPMNMPDTNYGTP